MRKCRAFSSYCWRGLRGWLCKWWLLYGGQRYLFIIRGWWWIDQPSMDSVRIGDRVQSFRRNNFLIAGSIQVVGNLRRFLLSVLISRWLLVRGWHRIELLHKQKIYPYLANEYSGFS